MQTRKLMLTVILTLTLIAISLQLIIGKSTANALTSTPAIILGISDGYESQYTICEPYLDTYDMKPFVMVIANSVNDSAQFESQDLMTWDEINELEAKGYNIVSHGYDHIHLASGSSTPTEMTLETNGSQCLIKDNTGTKPYIFVIPFGDRNATVNIYIASYYPICADDYFNCAWSPKQVFKYTNTSDIDYQYIPLNGAVGNNPNGNLSTTIKNTLTKHLDWLVGNGTGYAYIWCWHTVFASVASCRGSPYGDLDQATWEDCIDIIQEYVANESIHLTTINSLFGKHLMGLQIHDAWMEILPSCLGLMMLGVACGITAKMFNKVK